MVNDVAELNPDCSLIADNVPSASGIYFVEGIDLDWSSTMILKYGDGSLWFLIPVGFEYYQLVLEVIVEALLLKV